MNTSGQVIGFATQYYTLWSYRIDTHYVSDVHGNHRPAYETVLYTFHKNISKSIDIVTNVYPNISIDEGLRGKHRSFSVKKPDDLTPELIKFGKYNGYTISEIAEMDFDYLLWLRDNVYVSKTRELIETNPQIIKHNEKMKLEEDLRKELIRSTFIQSGEHTVMFERNPGSCLSTIDLNISFDTNCPQFVIDRMNQLRDIYKNGGGKYTEPLVTADGFINGVKYLIVFPQYSQINGMYPYKMGYINGKFSKTKGKEFKTTLVPIGFTYWDTEANPFYQILLVVS
jgi:hypothetical protein